MVLVITVGPLALLRSPAPAGLRDGIAYCEPEFNTGPEGMARLSDLQNSSPRIQALELTGTGESSADFGFVGFDSVIGLLTYDRRLTRIWLNAVSAEGDQAALAATLAEARRLSSDPAYAPCAIH